MFAPGSPCNVAFGAIGVFQRTHALRGSVFAAPVVDPRTGRASAVTAARVTNVGVVAVFADLTDFIGTLFVYRCVVGPIDALSRSVSAVRDSTSAAPIKVGGPGEIAELAQNFNGLIVMPDLSGDELARELRKARPEPRVVYMTGYSGEMDAATLRVDGPVVQKPFTRDSLLAAVAGALGQHA